MGPGRFWLIRYRQVNHGDIFGLHHTIRIHSMQIPTGFRIDDTVENDMRYMNTFRAVLARQGLC